jgi:hypothetical protein
VNINPAYTERELAYCINKVGCKGLVLRPNVRSIDSLKILSKIVPELGETKGELNAKLVPTLKYVILTPGDNEKAIKQQVVYQEEYIYIVILFVKVQEVNKKNYMNVNQT